MPVHELLELGGCALASGNAIQAWKALRSQQPVFQVWAAHFPDSEDPWRATAGALSGSSVPHQAPSGWCRLWKGHFLSQSSKMQIQMERMAGVKAEVLSIPKSKELWVMGCCVTSAEEGVNRQLFTPHRGPMTDQRNDSTEA